MRIKTLISNTGTYTYLICRNQSQPSEVQQIDNRNEHNQQDSLWEWDPTNKLVCFVRDYPKVDVLGLQKNLYFLTHSVPDSSQYESEFAVQLANYLCKQGYDNSQVYFFDQEFLKLKIKITNLAIGTQTQTFRWIFRIDKNVPTHLPVS
jgi:hypothetical protein